MLDIDAINRIARKAADAALGVQSLRVDSTPIVDSSGDDALNVLLVFRDDEIRKINGDLALNALVKIQDDLRHSGEDRFAVLEFATESELSMTDDD